MLSVLRDILQSTYKIHIDSSIGLVKELNTNAQKKYKLDIDNKKKVIAPKSAVAAQNLPRVWEIRAIDLLRKIGEMTTPIEGDFYKISASWATRHYFWAIVSGKRGMVSEFRLSKGERETDFHQKSLLSDQFGLGMAGLLFERCYNTTNILDMTAALTTQGLSYSFKKRGSRIPDYFIWDEEGNFYIVETKGTQTSRATAIGQLVSGLSQVPNIIFEGDKAVNTQSFVCATLLDKKRTNVLIVDPPATSEESSNRDIRIIRRDEFETRMNIADDAHLLRWAGQNEVADDVLNGRLRERPQPESKRINGEIYLGTEIDLIKGVRLFRGLNTEIYELILRNINSLNYRLRHHEQRLEVKRGIRNRLAHGEFAPEREDRFVSLGNNGTCMTVEFM